MKNLELKVKCKDHRSALKALKALNAEYSGILKQRDVYFNLSPGRLKLRSINSKRFELIYYRRANRSSAKFSSYYISEITHPKRVEKILKEIYGVRSVVVKNRKLYLLQNIRIHLDTVKNLGKFIEFEIVCSSIMDETKAHDKMKMLKMKFNILKKDILNSSYSDLLEL